MVQVKCEGTRESLWATNEQEKQREPSAKPNTGPAILVLIGVFPLPTAVDRCLFGLPAPPTFRSPQNHRWSLPQSRMPRPLKWSSDPPCFSKTGSHRGPASSLCPASSSSRWRWTICLFPPLPASSIVVWKELIQNESRPGIYHLSMRLNNKITNRHNLIVGLQLTHSSLLSFQRFFISGFLSLGSSHNLVGRAPSSPARLPLLNFLNSTYSAHQIINYQKSHSVITFEKIRRVALGGPVGLSVDGASSPRLPVRRSLNWFRHSLGAVLCVVD